MQIEDLTCKRKLEDVRVYYQEAAGCQDTDKSHYLAISFIGEEVQEHLATGVLQQSCTSRKWCQKCNVANDQGENKN